MEQNIKKTNNLPTILGFFDDFTLKARVMPAWISMMPLILLALVKGILELGMINITEVMIITLLGTTILYYIVRNLGKRVEGRLFKKLGNKPTTILLMFSDKIIDKHSKIRYHRNLNKHVEGLLLPMSLEEEKQNDSIEIYNSAINWLRTHVNVNRESYPMVYRELIKYNFWRNLYGLKYINLIIYLFVCLREIIIMDNFNFKSLFFKPYPEYIAFIILLISLLIMFFGVSKKNVEKSAFEYAMTLIEVCEYL